MAQLPLLSCRVAQDTLHIATYKEVLPFHIVVRSVAEGSEAPEKGAWDVTQIILDNAAAAVNTMELGISQDLDADLHPRAEGSTPLRDLQIFHNVVGSTAGAYPVDHDAHDRLCALLLALRRLPHHPVAQTSLGHVNGVGQVNGYYLWDNGAADLNAAVQDMCQRMAYTPVLARSDSG